MEEEMYVQKVSEDMCTWNVRLWKEEMWDKRYNFLIE